MRCNITLACLRGHYIEIVFGVAVVSSDSTFSLQPFRSTFELIFSFDKLFLLCSVEPTLSFPPPCFLCIKVTVLFPLRISHVPFICGPERCIVACVDVPSCSSQSRLWERQAATCTPNINRYLVKNLALWKSASRDAPGTRQRVRERRQRHR